MNVGAADSSIKIGQAVNIELGWAFFSLSCNAYVSCQCMNLRSSKPSHFLFLHFEWVYARDCLDSTGMLHFVKEALKASVCFWILVSGSWAMFPVQCNWGRWPGKVHCHCFSGLSKEFGEFCRDSIGCDTRLNLVICPHVLSQGLKQRDSERDLQMNLMKLTRAYVVTKQQSASYEAAEWVVGKRWMPKQLSKNIYHWALMSKTVIYGKSVI